MDTPIACTLTPGQREAREPQLAALRRALRSRDATPGGLRLTFDPVAEAELRAFTAAEAVCCPFLTLDLAAADDAVVLDVSGPAEARPIIDELF